MGDLCVDVTQHARRALFGRMQGARHAPRPTGQDGLDARERHGQRHAQFHALALRSDARDVVQGEILAHALGLQRGEG